MDLNGTGGVSEDYQAGGGYGVAAAVGGPIYGGLGFARVVAGVKRAQLVDGMTGALIILDQQPLFVTAEAQVTQLPCPAAEALGGVRSVLVNDADPAGGCGHANDAAAGADGDAFNAQGRGWVEGFGNDPRRYAAEDSGENYVNGQKAAGHSNLSTVPKEATSVGGFKPNKLPRCF